MTQLIELSWGSMGCGSCFAWGFDGMGAGAPTTPTLARGCVAPATSLRTPGQRGGLAPTATQPRPWPGLTGVRLWGLLPPTVGRVAFEPLANEGENNLRVVKRSASPTTRSTSDFQFGP